MAYRNYYSDDKNKNNNTGSNSSVISGNPNVGEASSSATKGSGFVNLDKYLNANRGQTDGLVDTLTGEIEAGVNENNQNLEGVRKGAFDEAATLDSGIDTSSKDRVHGWFGDQGQEMTESDWMNQYNSLGGGSAKRFWDHNQQTIRDRQNARIKTDYGTSAATSQALNDISQDQGRIRQRSDTLRNDKGAQEQAFNTAFNSKGNYNNSFGSLDQFLMNADQAANVRGGGVNKLNAGLDKATGSFRDVGQARKDIDHEFNKRDVMKNESTDSAFNELLGRNAPVWEAPKIDPEEYTSRIHTPTNPTPIGIPSKKIEKTEPKKKNTRKPYWEK